MQFTILVENESESVDLMAEHGISVWVETSTARILFDTGASSAFAENADRLGVPIEQADILVLSHAHADHTGGLAAFFERNSHAPVFAGAGITGARYSVRGEARRAIGIDPAVYEAHRARFRTVSQAVRPVAGLGISTVASRPHPAPSGNRNLYRERAGTLEQDPFAEEIFLWVEEPDGIRIVTGCSHSGIANIVEAASAYGHVVSVVGGFHLKGEEESRVRAIARRLSSVESLYTGHCTGREAYRILRDELGERVRYASTGTRAEC
jgi:7,8-dihydropterin-6-yl-methyl-4-(beta-D-ribofuranosyl)aminobenzene 5'-phosphate synthase